jgi:hypothetical protein
MLEELGSHGGNRQAMVAAGYERTSAMASHVLLAACSMKGVSRESHGRGRFTTALMKLLRAPATPAHTLTYEDIIARIDSLPEYIYSSLLTHRVN